jgi:hypothetical protein
MTDTDPMGEIDPMDTPEQCTATASTTGERCQNKAKPGTNVCHMHGGSAPQVEAKAQERLDRLADEVLKESEPQLFDLIASYDDAETVDEKTTVLREIRQWTTSILDRAPDAPSPTEEREHTGEGGGPLMILETDGNDTE